MTVNEGREGDGATASVRISSQIFVHNLRELEEELINSLPDEILQHILSFIPTKLAISTSILSKRWRHVWENTPSLSLEIDSYELDIDSINKTLTRYTARKMMSFQLYIKKTEITDQNIDRLIKFAMSRDVENIWLSFDYYNYIQYKIPEFFYINSIVKQITVMYADMIPTCSVSWTSLKTLSFHCFHLSDDESIAKILCGCPILESLTLSFRHQVKILDLSKLLRLRKLEIDVFPEKVIDSGTWSPGPSKILAPQVQFLRLTNPQLPCVLVDVSSLSEAKLDFFPLSLEELKISNHLLIVLRMQKMVEKLQNVQKLTFGEGFLKILSLAEFYKLPFGSLKVKDLTLETTISQYVVPSIAWLLQNSPKLKKLTVHTMKRDTIPGEHLDKYFAKAGWYPDKCWSSEAKVFGKTFTRNVEPKYVASFIELMLKVKSTSTLEKMAINLEDYHLTNRGFQELLQMVSVLTHDNNVSIFLSKTKPNSRNVQF